MNKEISFTKLLFLLFLLLFFVGSVFEAKGVLPCGDVNNDASVNVADLTYLVDYLFYQGPAPPNLDIADVDDSGSINVVDLTYLVDYLFFGGPEPVCPIIQPVIVHPETNEIVSGLTYIAVENYGTIDPSEVAALKLYYSVDDINWIYLHTAKSSSGNLWEFTLDSNDLDSGTNYIMVIMETTEEAKTSPSVLIQVNKLPIALATYSYNGNQTYSFNATNSFDSDGIIESFVWNYDDGNTDFGVTATHQFSIPGEHSVSLTVKDNFNAIGKQFFPVNPDQNAEKNCGCEKITIRAIGEFNLMDYNLSSTIISSHFPFDYNLLGALDDVNMQESIAKKFFIGTLFEVEAELTPNSNDPTLCSTEQKLKNTHHYNEIDRIWKNQGIYCPFNGVNWCDDEFNEKTDSFRKIFGLNAVKWIDFPGTRLFKNKLTVDGLWNKSNFFVKVEGPAGNCECFFDQNIVYDENGLMISNTIENLSGTNCFGA